VLRFLNMAHLVYADKTYRLEGKGSTMGILTHQLSKLDLLRVLLLVWHLVAEMFRLSPQYANHAISLG